MNKVAAVPATNLLAKISNAFQFNTNATATPIVMIKVMRILTCVEVSFPKFQALSLNPEFKVTGTNVRFQFRTKF